METKPKKLLCRYCAEKCHFAGTDSENGQFDCFRPANTLYLRTKADDAEHFCKLFAVPLKWYRQNFGIEEYAGLNIRQTPNGDAVYTKAVQDGALVFSEDVFSSAQYTSEAIGEWLAFDENGEKTLCIERGPSQQGMIFKDRKAYEDKKRICYIPENDNTGYTYEDFVKIAGGNIRIADLLFDMVDWQHPATLFDELLHENTLYVCHCGKVNLAGDPCWYCMKD